MDIQFHGANCLSFSIKGVRVVVDDNLAELGAKSVAKADDIVLLTGAHEHSAVDAKLVVDSPGEYEVSDISIYGIAARAHMDEEGIQSATMYKMLTKELSIFVPGHIYPDLTDEQLEAIGMVDVMVVPVGGNGYTLDPLGAMKIIKKIEPKIVIPTHYSMSGINYPVPQQELQQAIHEISMEPKETTAKLRLKSGELPELMQLIVLERA